MLEPIRDYKNQIVCFADAKTGLLESKYKKQTTKTQLAIGGEFIITKENTETVIKRISTNAFKVNSYPIAS